MEAKRVMMPVRNSRRMTTVKKITKAQMFMAEENASFTARIKSSDTEISAECAGENSETVTVPLP